MSRKQRLVVPKFATEAKEADWWFAHRNEVSADFEEAARAGGLNVLTKEKLRDRLAARPVTIRLPEANLALARKQAERKGLPYQTYIRSLLHETLSEREEGRR